MPIPTAEDYFALELAATRDAEEGPLAERLNGLQNAIDARFVRQVGSNVVEMDSLMSDNDVQAWASYSIIGRSTNISGGSIVRHSFVSRESSIFNGSEVEASIITSFSKIDGSKVRNSTIEQSELASAIIRESVVRSASIDGSDFSNSRVVDVIVDGQPTKFSEADLTRNDHLIDLGNFIGEGNGMLVYRRVGGGILIHAGCQRFDSTTAMLANAENAQEYSHLDEEVRQHHLRQLELASALIYFTVAHWQTAS